MAQNHDFEGGGKVIAQCGRLILQKEHLKPKLDFQTFYTEAYSCGWKPAREKFPGQSQKWSEAGLAAKKERLKMMQEQGVSAAMKITL